MRYEKLGKTGLKVSVLACGSSLVGAVNQEVLNDAFNYALDKGINLFVTSAAYRIAEEKISRAIGHRRNEFYIATTTDYRSAEKAKIDVKNSFRIFNTNYIDIYMIGGVRKTETIDRLQKKDSVLYLLKRYKKEGKIGHIGITGHRPEALARAIETFEIDVVLFIFNMAQFHALKDLIPVATKHDLGLIAIQPLGHGYLSPASKALRFVLSSPVDVAAIGMYSKDEIDENIAIAELPPTENEWSSLLKEAESIGDTGCRQCRLCVGWYLKKSLCPVDIDIPFVMSMIHYRNRYGLSPMGEEKWRLEVEKCKRCNECRRCEQVCPYNLEILRYVRQTAKSLDR